MRWTVGVAADDGVLGAAGCGDCSDSGRSSDPLRLAPISAADSARWPTIFAPRGNFRCLARGQYVAREPHSKAGADLVLLAGPFRGRACIVGVLLFATGKVVIKVWDMGGQEKVSRGGDGRELHQWLSCCIRTVLTVAPCRMHHLWLSFCFQYRGMWERYCRGVEVIVFVVDANDPKLFPLAQKEMQALLAQPTLVGVPLLVLLNKNDLPTAIDPEQVVKELYDTRHSTRPTCSTALQGPAHAFRKLSRTHQCG
jgi:GTPase SAR1 family protein